MRSTGQRSFPGVANARDCGAVWAIVQRAGSGYFGDFCGYPVPIEHSDRVLRVGRRDSVHQAPGIVRYK